MLFLSVRELELRKVRFDTAFAPGEIDFLDEGIRQTSDLETTGTAELVGPTEEIRIRGRLKVRVEAACDRCLEPAPFQIDQEFDLFYRPPITGPPAGEIAIDESESEVGFYENGGVELKDALREQVILALPMQRICREDCRGICPVCGRNRNVSDCGCRPAPVDDRWSALRRM